MQQAVFQRATLALIVVVGTFTGSVGAQDGPEIQRCLTREQLLMEPLFSHCPDLVDEASVSDNSFVSTLYLDRGYTSYSIRWQGPDYFSQDDYTWNPATEVYEGFCGTQACTLSPPAWLKQEHWDYYVGTLLAEDVGTWTYSELRDDELLQSRTFEVRELELSALSGVGQIGLVDEQIPLPLVLKLESFEGIPIEDEVIGWDITGPKGAKRAAVYGIGSGSETNASGIDEAFIRLGSKPGTYTVTLNNRRITADSRPSFMFTAIDGIEDIDPVEEHPEFEEIVGYFGAQNCDRVGNPITLSAGNKYQREVDRPAVGLSPIEFVRHHNSLGHLSRSFHNYWTHSYDRYVESPADPVLDPVKVVRPDGRKVNFFWNGSGYEPHPGVYSILEATGNGWRFTDEELTVETFDEDGLLLEIVDLSGMRQTAIRDSAGRLVRVESSLGDALDFTYDGGDRLATVTDSGGRRWDYRYDTLGRLAFVDKPDGATREYHYEDLRHAYALTGMTLENGQRYAHYAYDAEGRAIGSWHAGDADRVDIEYQDNGDRIVVDSLGNATVYQTHIENKQGFLDAISGPVCSQGCGETETQYAYDGDGNLVRRIAYGVVSEWGDYDALGQPAYFVQAVGTPEEKRFEYEYDPAFRNRVTRVTEPSVYPGASRVTERAYDFSGNLVEETVSGFDPAGQAIVRTVRWTYDGPYGQLTAMDGPRTDAADVTIYEYYADSAAEGPNRARLRAVVDPNGIRVRDEISYSATGKVVAELRPNGVALQYEYEPGSDRIASVTESGGGLFNRTTWTYYPTGDVERITSDDESGNTLATRFFYDQARRLYLVESGRDGGQAFVVEQRVSYYFDAAGNVTSEEHWSPDTVHNEVVIQRVFDLHNRLDRITQGGVTEDFDYGADGTLAAWTDGNLNTTRYGYDAMKRLTSTDRIGQAVTRQVYDSHGNLVSVTDPENHTTSYQYDDLGNRLLLDSPDTGSTTYAYDAAGLATELVDANGQRTGFSYDAGGRLTGIDREGAEYDVNYTYDTCPNGVGQLCSASVGWGDAVEYGWNGLGEVVAVTTGVGQVGYTYGPQGEPTSIRYPSGRVVQYVLDGAGRVEQVRLQWLDSSESVLMEDFEYSPMSRPIAWRFANGLQVDVQRDARQRTQYVGVGDVWSWQAGGYDGADNLLARTVDGIGADFAYDPLNRLSAADAAGDSLTFSYDRVGNRLARTYYGISESASYETGSNRLLAFGSRQYERDPNGNTTRMAAGTSSVLGYVYSPHNRLVEILDEASSAVLATYRYDAIGQRVEKSTPDRSRHFVYGRNGELLAVLDESGNPLHEYVYLDGQPVVDLGQPPETPPQAAPAETIIDDGQARFFGANWQSKRSGNAINGSYLQNRKRDDRAVYWYIDETGTSGSHEIFVRWVNPAGDGSQTLYEVEVRNDAGNGYDRTDVAVRHDDHAEGDWVLLGNFDIKPYDPDRRQYVSLSGFNNRYGYEGAFLEADAIRLVPTFVPGGSSDIRFIHNDHLGTPHVVSDESGQLVWKASFQPFGEAVVDEDVDGDGIPYELNLRFPGQYYDAESGLHYNYFRTYDPSIGRYIEADPSGLVGGLNAYSYAANNPLVKTDPLGLWVRRCSRQLGHPDGPNRSQDNPIRHDYLVVSGTILSFQFGESLWWGRGRLVTNGEAPDRDCPTVCGDDDFDEYVLEAARIVGEPNYCLVAFPGTLGHALGGRNCQSWVDDVLQLARESYLRDTACPRCFN